MISSWIQFVRQYGPVARNDNMYDETIQRSARRAGIAPLNFEHPAQREVLMCFTQDTCDPVSVVLTGTAGDGKTHLCRQVWQALAGEPEAWASDSPYLNLVFAYPKDRKLWPDSKDASLYRRVTIHFIRDLSGWAPQQGLPWEPEKEALLQRLCRSLFDPSSDEVFLIAANDGQLIEAWRRLSDSEYVIKARQLFEDLLVEDQQCKEGIRLRLFNLSRWSSAVLFDRCHSAFVGHAGWQQCYEGVPGENEAFGPKCPIRHNYELLKTPLVTSRLRALIELCDHNGFHLPIRQLLLLLSNAVLGHPDCKDHLMRSMDVPKLIEKGTVSKGSLFNNILGGNLSENRRQSITVFDYLDRNSEILLGSVAFIVNPTITVGAEGDAVFTRYDQSILNDNEDYSVGGFVEVELTNNLKVRAAGGYQWIDFDHNFVTFNFGPFLFTVPDQKNLEQYYVNGLIAHRINATIGQTVSAGHENQLGVNSNYITLNYVRHTLTWNLIRNTLLSTEFFYEDAKESGGFAGVFSPVPLGTPEHFHRIGGAITLGYQLTPHVTLGVRYQGTSKDSNLLLRDYNQNRVSVDGTYSF